MPERSGALVDDQNREGATMGETSDDRATVSGCLRLGAGFRAAEREEVVGWLSRLDDRLRSFRDDEVDMELSVKERDGAGQKVTLEVWLARLPRVVGTGEGGDVAAGVGEARDEVIRQIGDLLGRREPQANRHRRDSIRGSGG
jgi:hypothetical protein